MKLTPLERLGLKVLELEDVTGLDLAPLARVQALERLSQSSVRECRVPEVLRLSTSVRLLDLCDERRGATVAPCGP